MRSAASRTSSGPQTHRQNSSVKAPKDRSCGREHVPFERAPKAPPPRGRRSARRASRRRRALPRRARGRRPPRAAARFGERPLGQLTLCLRTASVKHVNFLIERGERPDLRLACDGVPRGAPTLPALSRGRAARTGVRLGAGLAAACRRPTSSRRSIRSRADRSRSRRQPLLASSWASRRAPTSTPSRPRCDRTPSSLQILRAVGEVALVASNAAAVADLAAHDPRIEFAEPDRSFSGLADPFDAIDPATGSRLRLAVRRRPGGTRDRSRRRRLVDDRRRRRQRCRRRPARPGRASAARLRRDRRRRHRVRFRRATARSSRA